MTQRATGAVVPKYHAVLREVAAERAAQDEKWGEQNHPDGTGLAIYEQMATDARKRCDTAGKFITYADILEEEFWEALAESDPTLLRKELIQVAAVAVAWVEKLDRDAA